jgi:DNA-directed RNA polymerase subunit RPC12/RpoP
MAEIACPECGYRVNIVRTGSNSALLAAKRIKGRKQIRTVWPNKIRNELRTKEKRIMAAAWPEN